MGSNNKRKTKEEFIEEASKRFNNKFDYSKVDYKNNKTKVIIICPEHGEFLQTPTFHLFRNTPGCPKCGANLVSKKLTLTKEIFLERAKIKYGDKFDYNNSVYINMITKIEILCPDHGQFLQTPHSHLSKRTIFGCPKCVPPNAQVYNTNNFIEKCNIIHNKKYDYSKSIYKSSFTKIEIICPNHGLFKQTATHHLKGSGCPRCKESIGEKEIANYLINNRIEFNTQKTFPNCKNKKLLPFDFYIPKYNLCIEYDGIQHFIPNDFFGGENKFKLQQELDKIKTNYCLNNNIKLIRIRYDENLQEKLNLIPI